MNRYAAFEILVLILLVSSRIWGEDLRGNANVDSAAKIDAMNQSVNENWNVNDRNGTRLLILFDAGSTRLSQKYAGDLKEFADYLKAHPKTTADIFGHSDGVSGKPADFELAQARANVVRQYLIDAYGIDGDRLKAEGYGQVTARATNLTKSEKQMNRRVFAIIKDESSASAPRTHPR
ncbi:MAG: OmpA family protein [Elusimicrobiota bacterium]|jgi:outer membrane protein OmpA-like peptidoglycan-associated protein